ncbi:chemotaxis protein CheW [Brevundimonas sp.]|jgi:purine-binding chemotaxis protein CheW|uniref:chemotaxis protein CheW n=1 Tax=Brevundimonas sp. TaxID=1871086 RepID=UPI00122033D9|nr:chemotaxis protein CheW [Brevundimonas sp.]TAJ56969.1 MAG: chemotaxis protein CheW [Brevundimonas sp.]
MSIRVENSLVATDSSDGLVSIRVGDQTFGVPVLSVQDVISETPINRVPLAPPEVAGSLNLRGRIVTAVDMRRRLGMAPRATDDRSMCVIVEHGGELYALVVDDVGDVLWLEPAEHEPGPVTLSPAWRAVCAGLYRLEDELLLVLNVAQVLTLSGPPAMAA